MSRVKIGLVALLLILLSIQFVQPVRNQSLGTSGMGITRITKVPDKVQAILENSCYDCHSNNTRYPWYASFQPGAWWMASHIDQGKAELNFDEFGKYSKRRQLSKLKAIQGSLEDQTMPLPSYLLVHKGASLSISDQKIIKVWTEDVRNEISK